MRGALTTHSRQEASALAPSPFASHSAYPPFRSFQAGAASFHRPHFATTSSTNGISSFNDIRKLTPTKHLHDLISVTHNDVLTSTLIAYCLCAASPSAALDAKNENGFPSLDDLCNGRIWPAVIRRLNLPALV